MNVKHFANKFVRAGKIAWRKSGRFIGHHKHELAATASMAMVLAGSVMACKKTYSIHDTLAEYDKKIDALHEMSPDVGEDNPILKQELRSAYLHKWGYMAKQYAIPTAMVSVGTVGVGWSVMSLKALADELGITVAALSSQLEAFKNATANNVTEETYTQIEKEFHSQEEPLVDDDRPKGLSPYAVYFEPTNRRWTDNPLFNMTRVVNEQSTINNLIKCDVEHIFMHNEVLSRLGFKRIKQLNAGYFYDPDDYSGRHKGVTFHYYHPDTGLEYTEEDFANGIAEPVWIDFEGLEPDITVYLKGEM